MSLSTATWDLPRDSELLSTTRAGSTVLHTCDIVATYTEKQTETDCDSEESYSLAWRPLVLPAFTTASFGWGNGWNVTSAGWQVTLCDPIWHVSSSSGEATSVSELLYPCYFTCYFTLLLYVPACCLVGDNVADCIVYFLLSVCCGCLQSQTSYLRMTSATSSTFSSVKLQSSISTAARHVTPVCTPVYTCVHLVHLCTPQSLN